MESRVEGLISMLHEVTDKSVAVGFGISAPDAVRCVLMNCCAVLLFHAGITILSATTLAVKPTLAVCSVHICCKVYLFCIDDLHCECA